MTEFRSRILQSKQYESSLIATSRKRKLRELYAVADCDGPVPLSWVVLDLDQQQPPSPIPAAAEAFFLEHNDILQRRIFDESSLPTRPQLRSQTAKSTSTNRKALETPTSDASRLSAKVSRDDGVRKSRGSTPSKDSKHVPGSLSPNPIEGSRRGRSAGNLVDSALKVARRASSKGSQVDLPPSSDVGLDRVDNDDDDDDDDDDGTLAATRSPLTPQNEVVIDEILEKNRILRQVESRPGSPGVDPRKAIPMSAEDAANLAEPLINGSQDEHHKAVTAHLPRPEVQEDHLRQVDEVAAEPDTDEQRGNELGKLSIKLPPPHSARALGDPMSSPGSTVEANSATTPALHEASTDTSPDNEGLRFEVDPSHSKDVDPETPPELAPTDEELNEKEEHDRLLKAQIDIARSEILGSSPTDADAQLRLEEEQAAAASSEPGREIPDSEKQGNGSRQDALTTDAHVSQLETGDLTESAEEIAQDILDDEDDEVVGIPTPEDDNVPDSEILHKPPPAADHSSATEPMDVDLPAVEDPDKVGSSAEKMVHETSEETSGDMTESSENPATGHIDRSTNNRSPPTPRRTPSGAAPTPPTLERMTTRVSSGAMRHKSVSEILGEIPRPNTASNTERAATAAKNPADIDFATDSNSQSGSATPQSPASRMRFMVERAKEKERSKLSTVVFAKQPVVKPSKSTALVPSGSRAQDSESAGYFMPLILSQAYNSTRGVQPLEALLLSARKTLSTANAYVPFHEHQAHKVLRRIHSMQSQDKWSLRQPKRSPEPNRPASHWDELLKEAKWMRTDFREERKWKMAAAKNLAQACAEWAAASRSDRKLLQVRAVLPLRGVRDVEKLTTSEASHPTSELAVYAENETPADDFDEEPRASLLDAVAPTAMFSLSNDDVVFGLRRTAATDKLLDELPMYGSPLKVHQSDLPTSDVDPDAAWRKPALPLSKYVEGKIILKDNGPPRKKSRYEYEQEDDEEDQIVFSNQDSKREDLGPALLDVALFNPQNKHIRDRLHAGHQFRPPSESPMPLQSFFECRNSSQWTWAEDDELKGLVREYSYNWQLISSMVSSRSLFTSSAERRTPWECFERWIHLEGLPADMQKTHYFRAYNSRLEAAQRNLLAQVAQPPPPQANAAGAAITPVRRRTTTSVRVERRRNQKHLTLVDAMRKLAKKRETSLQKQQHAAGLAAMRKANEVAQPQGVRHTPQDFSRLKHERDMQNLERLQRHQMQQEAQRRAVLQQRQNPQQYPNGVAQQPRNIANPNATTPVNLPPTGTRPNQLTVPGQNLPHAQMQPMSNGMGAPVSMPNGHGVIPQMPLKGVPQAQMQGLQGMPGIQGLPTQHRMPAPNPGPDLRLVMQARQISEQQRQAVQLQQQSQNGQIHNSPPNMRANMNGMNQQPFMQNSAAMMAAFNAGALNGVSTTPNSLNVPPGGSAGSPRMAHLNQPQQLNGPAAQIAKLEAQFRTQYPTSSPEQVNKFVRESLSSLNQNLSIQRQSAMHAAAGSGAALPGMPGVMQNSPQQYAQMLRAQQERQSVAASQQTRSASAGSGSGMGK